MRKINLVQFGVNKIRGKSLCKIVDDCGKKESQEIAAQNSKEKRKEGKKERKESCKEQDQNVDSLEKMEAGIKQSRKR